MTNSNLVQLISKLTVQEFREFGEYIRSPFFNKNESVIKLYDYLKNFYPDFEKMNFEKEHVYNKIFPKVEYDDAFMRKLMFNLSKLSEDYLAYKNFSQDKYVYYSSLMKELSERKINKLYQKKLKLMEDEFDTIKIKDTEYYRRKNNIETLRTSETLRASNFVNFKDKPDTLILTQTKGLIDYFLIRIIEEYRFLFNFQKTVHFKFDSEFQHVVVDYLKKNETQHNIPLLSLYFNSLLLITEKNETNYNKLKNLLLTETDSFCYEDKYSSFALLSNFANDEYQNGNKKFLLERFELHKLILDNDLYSGRGKGGIFFDVLFKNIVTVGLLVKEPEWVEKFIADYKETLDPETKHNTLNYCNARLNFEKGIYETSLEHLSKISSVHHFHYKPSIKSLTLMIYFEKKWFDQAYDVIDTYRHFISNDRMLPDFQKERNINFMKFCNELLKLKSKNSQNKVSDLKFELLNTKNVLEKEWLMEKVEEIEK